MSTRRVLVTGGAQRLGARICRAFAHAGWEVWCHFQHSGASAHALCAELQAQGWQAFAIEADLADATQRRHMVERIGSGAGALHCLVNNASSFEPDTALTLDPAELHKQFDVNLVAPLELASLLARQLPDDLPPGSCSVLHVLDQKVFNLNPDYFSYTVSKLALERTVALQAQALAPRIRVCGVAPGLMFLSGPQTQDNFDRASRVNLMQRAIDPAQVAATCVFLAQNPCITGVTLCVDNGQHLVPLERDVMFAVQDNQGAKL